MRVSDPEGAPTLTMREMSARSGLSEGTLRIWETRHGFPVPERLPSGHRRYSEIELKRVLAVVEARDRGLSLASAIEHARHLDDGPRPSVFARLRERFPHLRVERLPKPALLCLSRAVEDESCARGERPLLFGCFQQERFYRASESRWREMARTAERAVVLADFPRERRPRGGPAEIPIGPDDALGREWVLVCEAPTLAACLVGFEPPGSRRGERIFETLWSAEGEVVREAARVCCELIAERAPTLLGELPARLADPRPSPQAELRAITELTTRMVLYAANGLAGAAPQAAARAVP
ncbi:MAG: MerR family transcriptional regulator [Solirubrobacterales bacterium]|nr:MerR family transcriptional regulator [Solirubrobacterales bacterium]